MMLQTDAKTVTTNEQISRSKVDEWINKHPRSPWWISNARLADFCRIKHDGMVHNTAILGKYFPRTESFWSRAPGLSCRNVVMVVKNSVA